MFTDEERLKFSDWINEFERLVKELRQVGAEIESDPRKTVMRMRGQQGSQVWKLVGQIEKHLDHAPEDMSPRKIEFGGGGMSGVYGPPAIAPPESGNEENWGREPTILSTESSAGVGTPIYQDPLKYRDWGWTKHPKRPRESLPWPDTSTATKQS